MKNNENSFLKAAWLIAFVTIISKFVGFLRDICVANYYGAGMVSDAYFYAYQIPSLAIILMGGVGGPFHSATVSVFAKMVNQNGEKPSEEVNKLFNTFLTATFIFFAILAVLIFIFAEPILQFIIHSNKNKSKVCKDVIKRSFSSFSSCFNCNIHWFLFFTT